MNRRALAAAVVVELGLLGCPEPNLTITVKLPDDDISKECRSVVDGGVDAGAATTPLIVELAIYAPTESESVGCEQIAWGDVPTQALRSARVYNAQLLPQTDGVPAASASVPRRGKKIAVALGACAIGEFGITLREAVLAGCIEIGEIEGDARIAIQTERTASAQLDVDERTTLFLSADVPAGSDAPIIVEQMDASGELSPLETGLPLKFFDHTGEPVAATVRLSVIGNGGAIASQTELGPATTVKAPLRIAAPGHFVVVPRLRYQFGAGMTPIEGLAYRTLATSAEPGTLATELAAAESVAIGPIGAPPAAAFVLVIPPESPANPQVSLRFLTPRSGPTGEVDFDPTSVELVDASNRALGGPVRLLGFGKLGAMGSAVIAATPLMLLPQPALPLLAHLVASAGTRIDLRKSLDELTSPVNPFVPSAGAVGPCTETALPPILLHLFEPSTSTNHYWLYDPASDALTHGADHFLDPNASSPRPRLVGGLMQSVCADDTDPGARHRLLFVRPPGLFGQTAIFDLSAEAQSISDLPPRPREALLPGLISEGALATVVNPLGRLDLLAAVAHNEQFEVNAYTPNTAGAPCADPTACFELRYLDTLFTGANRPGPATLRVDLLLGHLTNPVSSNLAVLIIRRPILAGGVPGPADAELKIVTAGQVTRVGTLPIACEVSDACKMFAADIDGDGIDELLITTRQGEGGTEPWQARIIRFSP